MFETNEDGSIYGQKEYRPSSLKSFEDVKKELDNLSDVIY